MSKTTKLTLDIVIGAVLPVLILKYGTAPLGTLPAYLLAALVPVAWVLLDLFVITRRFNFISSYGGAGAILRGALAFWFVDGALFAFKDSASYLLAVLVFGLSALAARPVTWHIAFQGLAPDTAERTAMMARLLAVPKVTRALRQGALIIGASNLLCGIANYVLNLRMVTAPFDTPAFNDQVANVNAITRIALVLPDMVALFWAFSLMYKAVYAELPPSESGDKDGGDFWELVQRREDALAMGKAAERAAAEEAAIAAAARRVARTDFGLAG
ncbi:MAG: hypothetical protein MUF00_16090 [Gemmatimonadaceae bacterium]|jgi:hypothetical protein|nr:hypothetical protein [Gemmatimonadaceae bacterium]